MADYQFNEPRFHNAHAAREHLEAIRWPNGPVCPHCGCYERISKIQGQSHRPGLYQCLECREQFTVTVGTVFERSKISLDKWLLAAALMASSKKGISSKQVERMLGVTYKTAWFMTHRLREAMKAGGFLTPLGGNGKIVEADETYVGGLEKNKHRSKRKHLGTGGMGKQAVVSLVERNGNVRSVHIANVDSRTLRPVLESQIDATNTRLMTDSQAHYRPIARNFMAHETVNHRDGEYVRGDAHTNTVEGYFSILKRIIGTFHSVSAQHLQRYVTEFDFRYNHRQVKRKIDGKWYLVGPCDEERMTLLLKGISGKRLMYRRTDAGKETPETRAH